MPSSTLAIVTAHNEAQSIAATLAALSRALPGAALVVADDGSTDATSELARTAGAQVVEAQGRLGKGGAASLAAADALQRLQERADASEAIVLLCDADLGACAGQLAALVGAVRRDEADLAIAAFTVRQGGGFGVALGFARWAVRRCCGVRLSAPISGQRALKAAVLEDVLPFADGFGMELGMTIDALRARYRLAEIELDLSHRATGRTPRGFAHRVRQLRDFVRAYRERL
ncbi:MAG TPA: glycosyltransferase [Solirubrobacteraceae bacterium]|jgi:glycosyltransferase involved in cell wall biosynthesis|nr:glycosyltransferase [Solirubrobacteraceae bacterium]